MKVIKGKTLTGLILCVLLSLPLLSVAARVIYTQSNKNAYQSYSNVSVKENINITNASDIQIGTNYEFTTKEYNSNNSQFASEFTYISLTANDLNVNTSTYENLNFILISPNAQYIRFSNANAPTTWLVSVPYEENIVFDIVFSRFDSGINNAIQWFYVNQITFTTEKLDNAFEYSLKTFVDDNNFGKVDMTSWFSDMFLSDNAKNNLYVNFINWYLNYAMLITLMHFLFTVLMWFINYCRRLLDRGMNYDW